MNHGNYNSFLGMKPRVVLCVRGIRYETFPETLQKYPTTLLAKLCNQLEASFQDTIVLDCSILGFEAVLFYYQSRGTLARPPGLLMSHFEEICRYFKLPENDIKLMKHREGYICNDRRTINKFKSEHQRKLWDFFENPFGGALSGFYAVLNYILVVVAVVFSCAVTVKPAEELVRDSNEHRTEYYWFEYFELFCSIVFGCEYALRFVASPAKSEFLLSLLNIVDFVSSFPYLFYVASNCPDNETVLGLTRTVRVLKLFRLTKSSTTMQKTLKIISHCRSDITTLSLSIAISVIFCGSVVFFAEIPVDDTQFTSIAQSIWWAMQTIVPLGYGDIVPKGWLGKCFGSAVAIGSSLAFTVPLLFIGGKFLTLYFTNCGPVSSTNLNSEQIYELKRGLFVKQSKTLVERG